MGVAAVIAALCREPYHLSPAEVGRLTPKQIELLVRHGEGGTAEPDGPEAAPRTAKEWFWEWGKANKLAEYQIQALWEKQHAAAR